MFIWIYLSKQRRHKSDNEADCCGSALQGTLFIMTFVIAAKFVITSIWSAQKSAISVFFH